MQSKEYLRQLTQLDKEISLTCQRIEELKTTAAGVSSPGLYVNRVQVSRRSGRMSDLIDQSVDIEKRLHELMWQYILLKDKIINLIHLLDDPRYVELLYYKYVGIVDQETGCIKFMTLKAIANTMRKDDGRHYTEEHIKALHGEALKELDSLIVQRQRES